MKSVTVRSSYNIETVEPAAPPCIVAIHSAIDRDGLEHNTDVYQTKLTAFSSCVTTTLGAYSKAETSRTASAANSIEKEQFWSTNLCKSFFE